MKKGQVLLYILFTCFITVILVFYVNRTTQKKIAVVDAVRLFNQYEMKIELEKNAEKSLKYLGGRLDSVNRELQLQEHMNNNEKADALRLQYQQIKQVLNDEYAKTNQQINEAVWKRLNPLIDEYGKKQGLHLIIGANGMGSVLYNDSFYDHTEALVKYINDKYEDKL